MYCATKRYKMADELLCTLLLAAEKASRIARLCRGNRALFSLLIQEKGEKHSEVDFKTLADVFIQQMVTKDVKNKFGKLAEEVQGEENNQFTNTLGETISVEVGMTKAATANMLAKVLDGNEDAARLLADAAHEEVALDFSIVIGNENLKEIESSNLNLAEVGIWIDPIDCTSQYVKGVEDSGPVGNGIYEAGLQCVTVLIGAYCLKTGRPILGVVNQPFSYCTAKSGQNRWSSRCAWGYSHNGVNKNNLQPGDSTSNPLISDRHMVVLSLHDPEAKAVISSISPPIDACLSRGAGYKCMTVVDQQADLFLYTCGTSFKWDTCAPHAILLSCGGGVSVLSEVIKMQDDLQTHGDMARILERCQVKYNMPEEPDTYWKANSGGLLVYNSTNKGWDAMRKILQAFVRVKST